MKRPELNEREPIGITLKLISGLPSIRTPMIMSALARAMRLARRFGLAVVHYAVQSNHIHMIVEAKSKQCLTAGMRSLTTSMAKAVHRFIGFGFCGKVLKARYHAHVLKTPTEVKRAIRYVVFNLAKHKNCAPIVDPYSSVHGLDALEKIISSEDYRRLEHDLRYRPSWQREIAEAVSAPGTWLLSVGWRKAR